MSMTFEERLKAALGILARTDVRPIWYAPPLHRLLWQLSVRIRPPHFSGQLANSAWLWLVFLVPLLALYLAKSQHSWLSNLGDAAFSSLCAAYIAAGSYQKSTELNRLPAWEEVESPDQPVRPLPPTTNHWLRDA
jgi:hypothetical protein